MIHVAYVAAEVAPFSKTGGLADVAGSLPQALNTLENVRVCVFTPLHSSIAATYREKMDFLGSTAVHLGWREQYVGIFRYMEGDTEIFFLDNEYYFKRPLLFGESDDGERYAYFSKAVLAAIKHLLLPIDVLHCNDWHSAAIAPLVDFYKRHDEFYRRMRVVYTIHNLRYQGVFRADFLTEILNLPEEYRTDDRLKFYDNINLMKGGIVFGDRVTTVSPSYALEITYPFFGEGLDGLIREHRHKVFGILNGIDVMDFNPMTDPRLAHPYCATRLSGKMDNKRALQESLNFTFRSETPVISMVTRLADMKGLDLVQSVFPQILELGVQFILLGTGEERYHQFFREQEARYPNQVRALLTFDEAMARKIYAGSDLFLMPSLFEPCGLGQMIAHRYGTLPLVREVGGLRDSVRPYNQYTREGDGFRFANYNAHDMLHVLTYAVRIYREQPENWKHIVRQAMSCNHSWKRSAGAYYDLYRSLQ